MYFGDKAPYPYPQHLLLDLPLPFLTSHSLDRILQPQPGERILEIGPGTGLQTLHVVPKLGPAGQLDIVDIQKEMLGHVMRQARRKELTTISPSLSGARNLPFGDNLFDAVYLVTALGEIPEPELVIAEAARVIKPSGRLVVGEFFDRTGSRSAGFAEWLQNQAFKSTTGPGLRLPIWRASGPSSAMPHSLNPLSFSERSDPNPRVVTSRSDAPAPSESGTTPAATVTQHGKHPQQPQITHHKPARRNPRAYTRPPARAGTARISFAAQYG